MRILQRKHFILLMMVLPVFVQAKRPSRVYEKMSKFKLKSNIKGHNQSSVKDLVRTSLMKDIALKDRNISETSVSHFLKESSQGSKDIQGFYQFILKEGHRTDLKNTKELFTSWLVLNTSSLGRLNLISARQLSKLIQNLNQKELLALNSVFMRSHQILKTNKKMTPDNAFQKAMEEKGVKSERLRKCKR